MTSVVPFSISEELYEKLHAGPGASTLSRAHTSNTQKHKDYFPGIPRIPLPNVGNQSRVQDEICAHLQNELITGELNKFSPYLWLVATQDSSHISSLTHQIVRGRNIIITEKPDLHLTWVYDRVYLKPIPKVLLSYTFWTMYLLDNDSSSSILSSKSQVVEAAKGYLRSYSYLVRHRSDFYVAREKGLIPRHTRYAELIRFLQRFETIPDSDVSPRYHFGELRVGRLNFWFKVIFRRFAFQKIHADYTTYFARFYGPFLFAFSVLSIVLSAMQVLLQAKTAEPSLAGTVVHGFSISAMIFVAVVVAVFVAMFILLAMREILFACADLRRKKVKKASQC
ncbi:hypothetical protein BKA58DRAFT_171311 [Alternaria rosae]|uniref:uncharacterized protein n=1 Tax=Alternaria rosae TaxID=1187941 RepID=UPI001E8CE20B|nr:uncharacterized protein BKA58DRAFT_171311 [Alternaria rosae]KAH6870100.1 hypothetical protein BKA58DRAFT_171311 [Alternaria rosae]